MAVSKAPFVLRNIDTSKSSYAQIIHLYEAYRGAFWATVSISFEKWFAANMCAALGGVLDKLESKLNTIRIDSIPDDIKTVLQKNEFLSHYGYVKARDVNHTTIRYLKLKPTDGRFFHSYVATQLLQRPELPTMSEALKKKITESIYEIFVNAQIHSETDFIYTCGQFYPNKDKIEFTITDMGIGFKERIKRRFGQNLSSIQAIRWATGDGHSTKVGVPGGIGLAILREFVEKNRGKIQIVSGDGFFQFGAEGEKSETLPGSFPGTIVNLQFRTDDQTSYVLADENQSGDIF